MSESESVAANGGTEVVPAQETDRDASIHETDAQFRKDLDTSAATQGEIDQLPLDVIFDILKNQRRRHVVRYLKRHNTATLSDLAEHVAALENEKEVKNLTSSERKRVYVGLYQCHLPRMDDAGIVEFDSDRGTIELNRCAEQLDAYLIDEHEPSRQWSVFYLGIALMGGVGYALVSFGLDVGTAVSSAVVFLTLLAVMGCAVYQHTEIDDGEE